MTLNTIDGYKMKLSIYLFTYFEKCRSVPLRDYLANPLADVVSTQIGSLWLPIQPLHENRFQSNNNQASRWY